MSEVSKTRFEVCVDFVLERETEYNKDGSVKCERDPSDPGGRTKFGIDQGSHPYVNICALTREEAAAIYHATEWTRARCNELRPPWDLAVFDSAVNPGLGWCIPNLQRVAGTKADGWIGPKTIVAVNTAPSETIELFLQKREAYYRSRPAYLNGKLFRDRFLKGWLERVAQLRKACSLIEAPL